MTATSRAGVVRYEYEHIAYPPNPPAGAELRGDSVSPASSDIQLEFGGLADAPEPHTAGALYKRVRNVVTGRVTYFVRVLDEEPAEPFVPPSIKMTVVRKPVGLVCAARVAGKKCGGVMGRIDLSRLEEGLHHEGFECAACHRRVKYVPPGDR